MLWYDCWSKTQSFIIFCCVRQKKNYLARATCRGTRTLAYDYSSATGTFTLIWLSNLFISRACIHVYD